MICSSETDHKQVAKPKSVCLIRDSVSILMTLKKWKLKIRQVLYAITFKRDIDANLKLKYLLHFFKIRIYQTEITSQQSI